MFAYVDYDVNSIMCFASDSGRSTSLGSQHWFVFLTRLSTGIQLFGHKCWRRVSDLYIIDGCMVSHEEIVFIRNRKNQGCMSGVPR